MRLKAKRHEFHQNIHAHIAISEIILNTQDFEDSDKMLENKSSDLRPFNNKSKASSNTELEIKLSAFAQLTHSKATEFQFSTNGHIKPLFQKEDTRKAKFVGKILVVDDEKFNCDIIEGFLMILGF